MLWAAPVSLLCLGVYTTGGWSSPVGKFEKCFLEVFPVLWLLSKCLYWKSMRGEMGWVYRTRLKKSVSRKQSLGIAEKRGSLIFPTQYYLHGFVHTLASGHGNTSEPGAIISIWLYLESHRELETISDSKDTKEITICKDTEASGKTTSHKQPSHQLSLKSFLSQKQKYINYMSLRRLQEQFGKKPWAGRTCSQFGLLLGTTRLKVDF